MARHFISTGLEIQAQSMEELAKDVEASMELIFPAGEGWDARRYKYEHVATRPTSEGGFIFSINAVVVFSATLDLPGEL